MLNRRTSCVFVLVCAGSLLASSAFAGGYEVGENGPRAMGRSGAYVAHVDEAGALYYNPAGLTRTEGFNMNFNLNLATYYGSFDRDTYIFPDDSGQAIRYEKVINDHRFLPNPMLFVSHDFGLENVTFGAGVYAPAAVPRKAYPRMSEAAVNPSTSNPVVSRSESNAYQLIEENLFVLYPSIGAAVEIPQANLRLGLTLQIAWVQTDVTVAVDGAGFTDGDARLIGPSTPNGYFSQEDSNLYSPAAVTIQGFTGTGILGIMYDPIPELSFGFTYRPQHKVQTDGDVELQLSEQLSNLVTLDGTDASLEVPFPHVLRFGIDYRHLDPAGFELFDIELNVVHERWSVLDEYDAIVDATVSDENTGIITDFQLPVISLPFNFKNTTSFRLGSDINVLRDRETGDGLTLRAGAFYETAASPEEYTNLLFTSFDRIGVSAGASYEIGKFAIDIAGMFVHSPERTVDNGEFQALTPLWTCNDIPDGKPIVEADCEANADGEQPGGIVNNGTYKVNYFFVSAGFTYGW